MLALSVDHSLQPRSSAVAELCRQFCKGLHIPSQTLRIPWSHPPFPDRPGNQGPLETVARRARYRLLFDAMRNNHVSVLAMGHHADDQVETLIMRLARTKPPGSPVGMRRCRRWGMGSSSQNLDWAGSSGMDHWVVRPLLDVPKVSVMS
jgi:tRNA(Ile)-lysidine synthase